MTTTFSKQLRIAIPTGLLIAFAWLLLQISFFNQGWAQPGTTSLALFFAQIFSVTTLLFFSFRWLRNKSHDGFISFGKLMGQGVLTGVAVVIFGGLFFQIYISFINPEFPAWMNEMYNLSWLERGLSETEIQNQQATNDRLESPLGLIYASLFAIGMTAIFSILPAFLTMRNKKEKDSLEIA